MKRIIFIATALGVSFQCFAQVNINKARERMVDSVKLSYLSQAAIKYPSIRQAGISSEFRTTGDIHSKLHGNDLFAGQLQVERIRAYFTVPVADWGKYRVSTTLGALHQRIMVKDVTSYNKDIPVSDLNGNVTSLGLNIGISRSDSLFNKPVLYRVGASGNFNPEFTKSRVSLNGLVSFQIKRTAVSSLSAGLMVTLDPSSPLPVIPFISYSHKFQSLGLEFLTDFPTRVSLRKELGARSSLSLGSELAGDLAFFDINQTHLKEDAIYTTLELKNGLFFEHLLSKKVVLGVSGGVSKVINSRVFPRDENPTDAFIKNTNGSVPFFDVKLSFLPFWSGIKW